MDIELTTQAASQAVEQGFSLRYRHFKEFQEDPAYRPYWNKCMEAVKDRELFSHIIFCNDLLHIPPVKTFLLYYEQDLIRITGREDAALEPFVKKSIGAFWGMVFKFVLGYRDQEPDPNTRPECRARTPRHEHRGTEFAPRQGPSNPMTNNTQTATI